MKRMTLNAVIDLLSLLAFIPSLISGLVLYLILPSGGGRGSGLSAFLGIYRNEWATIHDILSLIFAALLIIHLLLHLKFFWNIRRYLAAGPVSAGEKDIESD